MSKFKETGLQCLCGKSSDAYAIDHDGVGFCFSCGEPEFKIRKRLNLNVRENDLDEFESIQVGSQPTGEVTYDTKGYRGLSQKTVSHYKITTKFIDGNAYSRVFEYPNGSRKIKKYNPQGPADKYQWTGQPSAPGLYGRDLFSPKDYKYIYITEGEDDAPSVFQAFGGHHAAVSVRSSSSALSDIESDYAYLNQFERIILAFDSDDQGQKAVKKIVSSGMFDFNKLYIVEFKGYKDANEFLQNGKTAELVACLKAAKKYTPDNIINSFDEIEKALEEHREEAIGTWPTESFNQYLYGLHRGQVICIKGPTGIGKSEIFRMMEYHLLKTSTAKMCMIHMEEDKARTIKGVATYELGIPCHLPDYGVSNKQVTEAYKKACGGSEDRVFIYTLFGGDDADDVLDSIRFVVSTGGVDVVFLDHITMLVTGMEEGDERRKLDYLSTKLKKMAKEMNFCLVLISHVNENGGTRGSKNIELIADTIIYLDRDKTAQNDYSKNVLTAFIEKNRFAGRDGVAVQPLIFNTETYKLEEMTL